MRSRRAALLSERGVFGLLYVSVGGGGWTEYGSVFAVGAVAVSGGERGA